MTQFSDILADALARVALDNGTPYPDGGARAWGLAGQAYLSFAMDGLPASRLRELQYGARDTYGPVILDCRWYERLKAICLEGQDIPEPLFVEMLDFLREG